ncbi:MAG: 30S ribosomal protein S13 [Deltaproteobacteria bacterium]|nr:30S ribosomal protein S13 [Deltaproteobacteria bacterium]
MARIAGIDLPKEKVVHVALTYIFGVGASSADKILREAGIEPNIRVKDLTDQEVGAIRTAMENNCKVEGDLRKEISMNIKRLVDLGAYRGLRHRKNLPVRGQRTKTNARTRKGPKKGSIMLKKKA